MTPENIGQILSDIEMQTANVCRINLVVLFIFHIVNKPHKKSKKQQ